MKLTMKKSGGQQQEKIIAYSRTVRFVIKIHKFIPKYVAAIFNFQLVLII